MTNGCIIIAILNFCSVKVAAIDSCFSRQLCNQNYVRAIIYLMKVSKNIHTCSGRVVNRVRYHVKQSQWGSRAYIHEYLTVHALFAYFKKKKKIVSDQRTGKQ